MKPAIGNVLEGSRMSLCVVAPSFVELPLLNVGDSVRFDTSADATLDSESLFIFATSVSVLCGE